MGLCHCLPREATSGSSTRCSWCVTSARLPGICRGPAWVCAVLWRERLKVGHATLNWRVGGAFLTVVILHALWDTFASLRSTIFVEFLGVVCLSLLVAVVSLVLLLRRVREARRASA
jgi:hypothetical protein